MDGWRRSHQAGPLPRGPLEGLAPSPPDRLQNDHICWHVFRKTALVSVSTFLEGDEWSARSSFVTYGSAKICLVYFFPSPLERLRPDINSSAMTANSHLTGHVYSGGTKILCPPKKKNGASRLLKMRLIMNTARCYLVSWCKTQTDFFPPFLWKGSKAPEPSLHISLAQVTVTISIYHSHPHQTCRGNQPHWDSAVKQIKSMKTL